MNKVRPNPIPISRTVSSFRLLLHYMYGVVQIQVSMVDDLDYGDDVSVIRQLREYRTQYRVQSTHNNT